jgi:hypothetical protein
VLILKDKGLTGQGGKHEKEKQAYCFTEKCCRRKAD